MAENSFPAYYVTGSIQCFIRTPGTAPNIYFLGTCEVQPDVRITQLRAEVKNSNFGVALPAQKTRQGQKADIALPLSYYSAYAVNYAILPQALPSGFPDVDPPNLLDNARGWEGRFSRGALTDGVDTFELWLVFERQTNSNVRNATLPIGWYFPQVELLQHTPVKCGPQETVMLLQMEARPRRIPQASHTTVDMEALERSHMLYSDPLPGEDAATTYFPAAVLVPQ